MIIEAENKIDKVDKKIPDIGGLATKTALTAVEDKIPDVTGLVKKSDYATEITSIKNDYVTNASLDSKINDLKAQHIADEAKKIDDKSKTNASDILGFENRLKQKEDIVDEGQRENSFARGFYDYIQQNYLVYECKNYSFKRNTSGKLTTWKSTGIDNLSTNSNMKAVGDSHLDLPVLENNGRMNLKFEGNYFVQNRVIHPNDNKVVDIYIAYRLDPISNFRSTDYTIQNALLGAVKITKNATDISKNKYEGYGICFDEGGTFTKGNITNGRNVIIFGADMSFSTQVTNKATNIYVLADFLVQGIKGTTIYAEGVYKTNFTEVEKKLVLSLHYNGDNSYLFVNGTQELKFKAKDDQIFKEKLCAGNISDDWLTTNSEKTGLYGNVYDFVVDYEVINRVRQIHDMHRYLMTKHGIA